MAIINGNILPACARPVLCESNCRLPIVARMIKMRKLTIHMPLANIWISSSATIHSSGDGWDGAGKSEGSLVLKLMWEKARRIMFTK